MEYTKGEWKAYIFETSGIADIVEQIDQRIIASCPTKTLAWDDIKANANLIAAAPDMYEALNNLHEDIIHDEGTQVRNETQLLIYRALDKADGKS